MNQTDIPSRQDTHQGFGGARIAKVVFFGPQRFGNACQMDHGAGALQGILDTFSGDQVGAHELDGGAVPRHRHPALTGCPLCPARNRPFRAARAGRR